MPGLVNGHQHAQTHLNKGVFDRSTLETYLVAQPGATGRRTLEDKALSATLGAAGWRAKAARRANRLRSMANPPRM